MRIFAWQMEIESGTQKALHSLANILKTDVEPYSATLMAGTHWLAVSETKDDVDAKTSKTAAEAKEATSSRNQVGILINAATWNVLDPKDGTCTPPKDWIRGKSMNRRLLRQSPKTDGSNI